MNLLIKRDGAILETENLPEGIDLGCDCGICESCCLLACQAEQAAHAAELSNPLFRLRRLVADRATLAEFQVEKFPQGSLAMFGLLASYPAELRGEARAYQNCLRLIDAAIQWHGQPDPGEQGDIPR